MTNFLWSVFFPLPQVLVRGIFVELTLEGLEEVRSLATPRMAGGLTDLALLWILLVKTLEGPGKQPPLPYMRLKLNTLRQQGIAVDSPWKCRRRSVHFLGPW